VIQDPLLELCLQLIKQRIDITTNIPCLVSQSFYTVEIILFSFLSYSDMISLVIVALVLGWIVPESQRPPDLVIFIVDCVSVIPIAYFIGMAVSSVAAQSNYLVGAVLTVTFGSIIDIIIYVLAILQGLNDLVIASMTGSIIAMTLFLPGLAMVFGGLKYRYQRFNQIAAGVGSTLLMVSIIGAFTPTIFYHVYGTYELRCDGCYSTNGTLVNHTQVPGINCFGCHYLPVRELLCFFLYPSYFFFPRPHWKKTQYISKEQGTFLSSEYSFYSFLGHLPIFAPSFYPFLISLDSFSLLKHTNTFTLCLSPQTRIFAQQQLHKKWIKINLIHQKVGATTGQSGEKSPVSLFSSYVLLHLV